MNPTAHLDTFTRDNLPPESQRPVFLNTLPALEFPAQLNCVEPLLDRHIREGRGDRPAVRSLTEHWTYADLAERVNRIANLLVEQEGVRPGNRVLMRFPNSPLFAACYLAVLKCGAVAVPTMPLLRARELKTIADKAEVSHALADSAIAAELADVGIKRRVDSDQLLAAIDDFSDTFEAVPTASDDVALIAFTSGTTGNPKGCMHYHSDVIAMCATFSERVLKPAADDVFIGSPPLAFTFGLGGLLTFPLYAGASTVLLGAAPPPVLADAIEATGATICFTAPTAYKVLLAEDLLYKLTSLRLAVSAGEHLPKPVYEEWSERSDATMIDGIGATEIIHIFLSMTGEDDVAGSTGIPVPGYELAIFDEQMNELGDDVDGLLGVRGPTGCKYLADERQTDYVREGWNLTGDVFRRDADGRYWYVARNDDMIICSGYNISGPEVESALLCHAAVRECAVVAAADSERGAVPKAFVVLADGVDASDALTDELKEFVKGTIAPFKYPRHIDYIDELPKTQTGKIKRFALRK